MFRKPLSLSRQLVMATALALGASSIALADDPSIRDFNIGQNRGNLNVVAQNPCPPGTESTGVLQKKDEPKVASKAGSANRGMPATLPNTFDHNYFNQWPGQ